LNRGWVTNPGTALACSLVLRLTVAETAQIQLFSPLAGLAVCRAMEKRGLPAEIKWPNDVLLARRKTCGILVESSWQGDRLTGVVVGIGINVAPGSIPPADQQQFPATCVEAHAGTRVDRWQLLADVLVEFITWRPKIGSDAFFAAWEDRLAFKGEKVTLKNAGGTDFNGILLGVNQQGDLRIRLENGSEKLVSVGDVHLRRVGD
jgi:BirA family biotin operon repressor/biotin-[acetyl-CoA-carboxylase] ligase